MNWAKIKQDLADFLAFYMDRLWLVDNRLLWEGMEEFHRCLKACDADLLVTEVSTNAEDTCWTWRALLKAADGVVTLSRGILNFLPIVRVRRKAAQVILQGIDYGGAGNPGTVCPTMVDRTGLKIEDIGGTSSFPPPERIRRCYEKRTWHGKGLLARMPGKVSFSTSYALHEIP